MNITIRCARITTPIFYQANTGRKKNIPIGPCLVEGIGGHSIDIIWGTSGESSVVMLVEEFDAAMVHGHLVLLD